MEDRPTLRRTILGQVAQGVRQFASDKTEMGEEGEELGRRGYRSDQGRQLGEKSVAGWEGDESYCQRRWARPIHRSKDNLESSPSCASNRKGRPVS